MNLLRVTLIYLSLAIVFTSVAEAADAPTAKALLEAAKASTARVQTVDGRLVEGKLTVGNDGNLMISGQGAETIAQSAVQTIWVKGKPDREAMSIGGFIGGNAGGIVGIAAKDVNSLIATGVGTALGYAVGFAFRDRESTWDQIYPAPPAMPIVREGWFLTTGGSVSRPDIAYNPGVVLARTPDDWFLFGVGSLGRALSQTTSVALQSRSWLEPDLDLDFYDVFTVFTVAASRVVPGTSLILGVGAGPAAAEHNAFRDEGDVTNWGWGAMAMAAYEFQVGQRKLLGPMVSFDHLKFDGDFYDDVTVWGVGIQLTTY